MDYFDTPEQARSALQEIGEAIARDRQTTARARGEWLITLHLSSAPDQWLDAPMGAELIFEGTRWLLTERTIYLDTTLPADVLVELVDLRFTEDTP